MLYLSSASLNDTAEAAEMCNFNYYNSGYFYVCKCLHNDTILIYIHGL